MRLVVTFTGLLSLSALAASAQSVPKAPALPPMTTPGATGTAARSASEDINFMAYGMADSATKALVARVVAGIGGEARLAQIRSVRKVASISEKTAKGPLNTELDGLALFPNSVYARVKVPNGEFTAVTTPQSAFMYKSGSEIKNAAIKLNENEKRTLTKYFYEEPLLVLKNRIDPKCLFARGNRTSINNRDTEVLYVRTGDVDVAWYVDSETGRVIRSRAGAKITDFSDFRDVDGLILPFKSTSSMEGNVGTTIYKGYELNPAIDTAALFATPTMWTTRQPLPGGYYGYSTYGYRISEYDDYYYSASSVIYVYSVEFY